MKLQTAAALLVASQALAADHLVSERAHLLKRQSGSDGPATKNVTFLHINDVHAHLDEFASGGGDCPRSDNGTATEACFGGYARVIQKANDIREENPDALFLNAGDEFQGTLYFSYYGGEKIAEVLNQADMDAFTLGNHEFDNGDDFLADFLDNITMPTVASNVFTDNERLAEHLEPFLIFPQHEMGVVSLTTNTTPGIASPGNGTTFGDYLDIQDTVNMLLEADEGADNSTVKRVVALTHIGYDNDIWLAENTRNIHLIIGGHSHSRLGNDSEAVGEYPTIVRNLDDEEVFVVTAWRWGQHLGHIEVEFEADTGRILSYTGAPIEMTDEYPQNETLQDDIVAWRGPFEDYANEVIGETESDLEQSNCQSGECTLGNAVCDSMLYARRNNGGEVDFALHNAGGIRATIDAPEITRGEILTAFPFGNELVDVEYTGEELWSIFEGIVSEENSEGEEVTSFVQVSEGCAFTYNPDNPVGSRLISLNIGDEDVDFERTYTIVTLDFIATGGDAIFPDAAEEAPPTLGSQDQVFEDWVEATAPLRVEIEGRITTTDLTEPEHTVS